MTMEKYIRPETKWVAMVAETELLDVFGSITDDPATEPAMGKEQEEFDTDFTITPHNVWDE